MKGVNSMRKRVLYAIVFPLLLLLVACAPKVNDPLELIGHTFQVENLRTNKDYDTVTIEAEGEAIQAVGATQGDGETVSEVMTVAAEPDETGYYLVEWGDKTYYAGRVDEEVYFWFTHNPDEIGSTEKNEYVLKLIEED
jgi:hypothetical protein